MNLNDQVEHIFSREDFMHFLYSLLQSYHAQPEEWEHRDLESYLAALLGWYAHLSTKLF